LLSDPDRDGSDPKRTKGGGELRRGYRLPSTPFWPGPFLHLSQALDDIGGRQPDRGEFPEQGAEIGEQ
jgi:hypothetical protein